MKLSHRLLSFFLIPAMLCGITLGISAASPLRFSEGFETVAEGKTYPSSKLWVQSAKFTVMSEEDNQYLRLPFYETNKDAAIVPFSGRVLASHKNIAVGMDLRPVHKSGNEKEIYEFRVRTHTYTDASGAEVSARWKVFFRLHVKSAEECYLTDFSGNATASIPISHGEWNHVILTFDLETGKYAVTVGDRYVLCDLGMKNLGFEANQFQFCNLLKSCTYATDEARASYLDVDNLSLSQFTPVDESRYEGMLRSVGADAIRLDHTHNEEGATGAGIRFLTEVRRDLLNELKLMKVRGEAIAVEVGTLISPTDYLDNAPLTKSLTARSYLDLRSDNGYYQIESDERAILSGSIVGIKEKNLGRSFTARAYVTVLLATGQSFTVFGEEMQASAKALAASALDAHNEGNSDYTAHLPALGEYAAAPDFYVGETVRVMSYNVYYTNVTDERAARVLDVIEANAPDIVGLQEVTLEEWKPKIMERLGDTYEYLGHGRENGGVGEGTPILYRKDKFTLIESGTRWLSDTPTVWSKYEGARQSRIYTYAILSRNADGKVFTFINTHLDTAGPSIRLKQIASLSRQITEMGLDAHPMILTGDMNAKVSGTTKEIQKILEIGMTDTMDLSVQKTTVRLANGVSDMIDFCFVTDGFTVLTHNLDNTKNHDGATPSDHCPVVTDVRFP